MLKQSLQNRNGVVKTLIDWDKEAQNQSLVVEKSVTEVQESEALEEVALAPEPAESEKPKKGRKK